MGTILYLSLFGNVTCLVIGSVCLEAVSQVSAVANHINDHIKQQDNFMKMLAIQKSLCGPSAPKILVPGRMFIKEGRLKKVNVYSFPSFLLNWPI